MVLCTNQGASGVDGTQTKSTFDIAFIHIQIWTNTLVQTLHKIVQLSVGFKARRRSTVRRVETIYLDVVQNRCQQFLEEPSTRPAVIIYNSSMSDIQQLILFQNMYDKMARACSDTPTIDNECLPSTVWSQTSTNIAMVGRHQWCLTLHVLICPLLARSHILHQNWVMSKILAGDHYAGPA